MSDPSQSGLAHLIGDDAAFDLLETSRIFNADDALEVGFLTDIQPAEDWATHVDKLVIDAGNLGDDTKTALLAATHYDSGLEHDLAALVQSAAKPGLANRMRAFVTTQVKKQSYPAQKAAPAIHCAQAIYRLSPVPKGAAD